MQRNILLKIIKWILRDGSTRTYFLECHCGYKGKGANGSEKQKDAIRHIEQQRSYYYDMMFNMEKL